MANIASPASVAPTTTPASTPAVDVVESRLPLGVEGLPGREPVERQEGEREQGDDEEHLAPQRLAQREAGDEQRRVPLAGRLDRRAAAHALRRRAHVAFPCSSRPTAARYASSSVEVSTRTP